MKVLPAKISYNQYYCPQPSFGSDIKNFIKRPLNSAAVKIAASAICAIAAAEIMPPQDLNAYEINKYIDSITQYSLKQNFPAETYKYILDSCKTEQSNGNYDINLLKLMDKVCNSRLEFSGGKFLSELPRLCQDENGVNTTLVETFKALIDNDICVDFTDNILIHEEIRKKYSDIDLYSDIDSDDEWFGLRAHLLVDNIKENGEFNKDKLDFIYHSAQCNKTLSEILEELYTFDAAIRTNKDNSKIKEVVIRMLKSPKIRKSNAIDVCILANTMRLEPKYMPHIIEHIITSDEYTREIIKELANYTTYIIKHSEIINAIIHIPTIPAKAFLSLVAGNNLDENELRIFLAKLSFNQAYLFGNRVLNKKYKN